MPARRFDMIEELKGMPAGSRLGEADDAAVLLGPGEAPAGPRFEEALVTLWTDAITDARLGEIVWPVEDE